MTRRPARAVPGVNDAESSSSDSEPEQASGSMTSDQVEKLVQLGDLTGIDDLEVCRAILESKNWDLEAAAREQLDDGPPPPAEPPVPPAPRRPHEEAPEVRLRLFGVPLDEFIRIGFYYATLPLFWPLRAAFDVFGGLFRFLFGSGPGRLAQPPASPTEDVETFRRRFDAEHPDHGLPFFRGSYSDALELAKRELRFLIAYLHSPSHQDAAAFARDVLCSRDFRDFLDRQNAVLFGASVETREGHRLSEAVRATSYPSLVVIVLRQNKMMIVGRHEGWVPPSDLVGTLTRIVDDNEAFVVAARADRREREANELLRREQDLAFQETLRQDQEKERRRQEEEARRRAEREALEAKARAEEDRKAKIARAKVDLASRIPEEAEGAGAVRVVIKLPGGQRLERKFDRTTSVRGLFYYVFCHPDSPSHFDITTNFPRKVLPCRPAHFYRDIGIDDGADEGGDAEPPSFEAVGITGSTMLFVNDLEA